MSHAHHRVPPYATAMTKPEIVWHRVTSRVEGAKTRVDVLIAAVPGGHLVSTNGPSGPGLCFVPGKSRAVGKLIARAVPKASAKKKKRKPKSRRVAKKV